MFKLFVYFFLSALILWGAYLVLYDLCLIIDRVARNYLKFGGTKVIVCPETRRYAAVEVDAPHAAATAATGAPDLRLRNCTRWRDGERARDCDQDCLWQIERAPEDCAARTMLTRYYDGKSCAFCGKPIGDISWTDHKPALLHPDDLHTVEWDEVAPERLPTVLGSHLPVCWNCHVAERFRAEHSDLVVERVR